jgi:hypothetical protein
MLEFERIEDSGDLDPDLDPDPDPDPESGAGEPLTHARQQT